MNLVKKVKKQLKHISDTVSEYGEITLQESHTVVCEINGIKYSYNLRKGCVVPNVHDSEIAKIIYVWETVDKLYKGGKIKIEDLKE
jgi:hypothetical protein